MDRSLNGGIVINERTTGDEKNAASNDPTPSTGIAYWTQMTLQRSQEAEPDLAEQAVHDLRVSIRRCRSMTEDLSQLDPDPRWDQLRGQAKKLFRDLGRLRDLQVMELWLAELAPPEDPVRLALESLLRNRQEGEKERARKSLARFDRKRWRKLAKRLSPRAERFPDGSPAFLHQALVRWEAAYTLHRLALRDRSKVAFHRLRIGLKRFRYTVENFLPELHRAWQRDLKEIQDCLGEIHDLDVLWAFLPEAGDFFDRTARQVWRRRVVAARQKRLVAYRTRMVGSKSLWIVWRADLPNGEALEEAAFAKLTAWVMDPGAEPRRRRVEELAVRAYGLLKSHISEAPFDRGRWLAILRAGAIFQCSGKGGAKRLAKEVLSLPPPLTWRAKDLQAIAAVIRCAGTANPDKLRSWLADLPSPRRRAILTLAALLRFARALQKAGLSGDDLMAADSTGKAIRLHLRAGERPDRLFLELGARKNLLEWACRRPIILELGNSSPPDASATTGPPVGES